MTVYGYARVSTDDQNLDLQLNALNKAGCEHIFCDHGVGGLSHKRVELSEALKTVEAGDELVVWRLDRLARSMFELVSTVKALHERRVVFKSLCEHIDVNSAFGELVLHILSAIAHFERELIVERTRAGMQAAKQRGVQIGRRPALDDETMSVVLAAMIEGESVSDMAAQIGVGRSTLYRYIAESRQVEAA